MVAMSHHGNNPTLVIWLPRLTSTSEPSEPYTTMAKKWAEMRPMKAPVAVVQVTGRCSEMAGMLKGSSPNTSVSQSSCMQRGRLLPVSQ